MHALSLLSFYGRLKTIAEEKKIRSDSKLLINKKFIYNLFYFKKPTTCFLLIPTFLHFDSSSFKTLINSLFKHSPALIPRLMLSCNVSMRNEPAPDVRTVVTYPFWIGKWREKHYSCEKFQFIFNYLPLSFLQEIPITRLAELHASSAAAGSTTQWSPILHKVTLKIKEYNYFKH
jgi:hypothetical protein